MKSQLIVLLCSGLFACRSASVKLDDNEGNINNDTANPDDTDDTDTDDTDTDDTDTDDTDTDDTDTDDTDTDDTDTDDTDTDDTDTDDTDTDDTDTDDTDTDDTDTDPNNDQDDDGTITNEDCDDNDPLSTIIAEDADCDGTLTANDCNDNDASSTILANDADCDSIVLSDDCDDNDASSTVVATDADCDGILTSDDCDDSDSAVGGELDWYLDSDVDGYGSAIAPASSACTAPLDGLGNPLVSNQDDCDDNDSASYPGAPEVFYDGIDQDCAGQSNEYDQDGDGYEFDQYGGTDCDDTDASIIPEDADGDGVSLCSGDCDDTDANAFPGNTEVLWDSTDNDCDGTVDQITSAEYSAALEGDSGDFLTFDNSLSFGDFNLDGVYDVAVGGTYLLSNATGGVHLIDGIGLDWTGASMWSSTASSEAFSSVVGVDDYNYFGSMPAMQGDVNGDGTPDFAAAGTDHRWDDGDADVAASIYFNVTSLSGTEYQSENADINFYESMSGWGNSRINTSLDLNGDGINEVIFSDFLEVNYSNWNGGYSATSGNSGEGSIYIFDGLNLVAGDYFVEDDYDVRIDSESQWDYLGMSVNGADLNGDGTDELIITAAGDDEEETNGGCVFLLEGIPGNNLSSIGDFDISSDSFTGWGGIQGFAICASTDPSLGNGNGTRLSFNSTPQFADFNGDGSLDLAIAAPGLNKVYIYLDAASLSGLYDAENDADIIIDGAGIGGWFGYALTSGDFDGDGLGDLIIGAPAINDPISMIFEDTTLYSTGAATNIGMVYLFSGADLPVSGSSITEANASGSITSTSDDLFGMVLNAVDMSNNGQEDLWVGAPYHGANYEGMAYYFASP